MAAFSIPEQTFYEPAAGLTFKFRCLPDGTQAMDILGELLPFGNRTIIFGTDGLPGGGGTHLWDGEA